MQRFEIDGQSERAFCNDMETLLRQGEGEKAPARLKALLAPYCSDFGPFPARCFALTQHDVEVNGWDDAIARIAELERGGKAPITAIGVDISWPGHRDLRPDAAGELNPDIETNFYSDSAFPFSTSDRAGLLAGYSGHASEWQGAFEDIDSAITLAGIGDLYGAIWRLKAKNVRWIDEDRASALGAMLTQVLLHLAVRDSAPTHALPRPMAILVGSNEEYPFFDAPVLAAMR